MKEVRYKIDEELQLVEVGSEEDFEGNCSGTVTFSILAQCSSLDIESGHLTEHIAWSLLRRSWRECYAIARDELIERGLIEDKSEKIV